MDNDTRQPKNGEIARWLYLVGQIQPLKGAIDEQNRYK